MLGGAPLRGLGERTPPFGLNDQHAEAVGQRRVVVDGEVQARLAVVGGEQERRDVGQHGTTAAGHRLDRRDGHALDLARKDVNVGRAVEQRQLGVDDERSQLDARAETFVGLDELAHHLLLRPAADHVEPRRGVVGGDALEGFEHRHRPLPAVEVGDPRDDGVAVHAGRGARLGAVDRAEVRCAAVGDPTRTRNVEDAVVALVLLGREEDDHIREAEADAQRQPDDAAAAIEVRPLGVVLRDDGHAAEPREQRHLGEVERVADALIVNDVRLRAKNGPQERDRRLLALAKAARGEVRLAPEPSHTLVLGRAGLREDHVHADVAALPRDGLGHALHPRAAALLDELVEVGLAAMARGRGGEGEGDVHEPSFPTSKRATISSKAIRWQR